MAIWTPWHMRAQAPWQVSILASKMPILAPKVAIWSSQVGGETPVEVWRQLGLRRRVWRVRGVGARLKRNRDVSESESKGSSSIAFLSPAGPIYN